MFSLKSGIWFSMTSKITRQMIHQAHNSAGVLLCARQRTIHGSFQAVTFSVWQEQERKIRRSGFLLWVCCALFYLILLGKYLSNHSFCTTKYHQLLMRLGIEMRKEGDKKGETIPILKEFITWLEKPGYPSWKHHSICTIVQIQKQGHRR